jgi:sulfofructose kinase
MGLNSVDHLCVIPHFPKFDSKLKMLDFRRQGGGQAATAMVACQRLGLKTRYLGKVGDDDFGHYSKKSLEDVGVNVEGVVVVPGARNQFAFILIDQRNGERTIIWDRDRNLITRPEEVPRDIICSAKVLLIDGHDAAASVQAAKWAREEEGVVVMDAERISEETTELVSLVDVLIGEKHFPERFTGISDLKEALSEITGRGPRVAGVTMGKEGASALRREHLLFMMVSFTTPLAMRFPAVTLQGREMSFMRRSLGPSLKIGTLSAVLISRTQWLPLSAGIWEEEAC